MSSDDEFYTDPPDAEEAVAKKIVAPKKPKVKRAPSAWNKHVSAVYKKEKKKNPKYKFKDAVSNV